METNKADEKNEGKKNDTRSIEEIYDSLCLSDKTEAVQREEKTPLYIHEIHDAESEDRISHVCVLKTGDTQYYDILKFIKDPVTACHSAFRSGENIYTDSRSIKVIVEEELEEHYKKIEENKEASKNKENKEKKSTIEKGTVPDIIYVGDCPHSKEMSQKYNITEAAAGFLSLKNELDGSVVLIGKDESSLLSICRLIEKGVKPAAVLAFPSGGGTQNKSKLYLRENCPHTPTISTMSAKGGRDIAAICAAEIIKIVNEKEKRVIKTENK